MDDTPIPSPPRRRTRLPTGLGAMAVVVVMVVLWWLLSGNGPSGPAGNDSRFAVPDADATGTPADGSSAPVEPAAPLGNGVRIDGFVREGGSRIAVNYTAGLPECYGSLDTPEVLETDAAVTITLTLVPPEQVAEDGCPDLAVLRTVRVDLDASLGDRSVLDGSLAQPVRVREARRANE